MPDLVPLVLLVFKSHLGHYQKINYFCIHTTNSTMIMIKKTTHLFAFVLVSLLFLCNLPLTFAQKLTTRNLKGTIWEERTVMGPVVINTTFQFLDDFKVAETMITTNTQTLIKKQYRDICNYTIVDDKTIIISLPEGQQEYNLSWSATDSYLSRRIHW